MIELNNIRKKQDSDKHEFPLRSFPPYIPALTLVCILKASAKDGKHIIAHKPKNVCVDTEINRKHLVYI